MITRDTTDFDKLHEALRTTYKEHSELVKSLKEKKLRPCDNRRCGELSTYMTRLCVLMAFIKGRKHIDRLSLDNLSKYGIMHSRFPSFEGTLPRVTFYGTNSAYYITDDNNRLLMNEHLCQRIFGDLWKDFVKEENVEVAV